MNNIYLQQIYVWNFGRLFFFFHTPENISCKAVFGGCVWRICKMTVLFQFWIKVQFKGPELYTDEEKSPKRLFYFVLFKTSWPYVFFTWHNRLVGADVMV